MVKVAVVGAGNLGTKIAGDLAYHGNEVTVYDKSPDVLEKARRNILEDKHVLYRDGVILSTTYKGQVFYTTQLNEAVQLADYIIEATPEDLELKKKLFKNISDLCKKSAVVATSSLNLNIDDIIQDVKNRENCLVIRFLYPVYCIPEVEIVPSVHTTIDALDKVRSFLSSMGKVAFFRRGRPPLVLTPEQREMKKQDYIRNIKRSSGCNTKMQLWPNLDSSSSEADSSAYGCGGNLPRMKDCVVCMDAERNCVMHPCHHMCTCMTCGNTLKDRGDSCPICRSDILSVFRIYLS